MNEELAQLESPLPEVKKVAADALEWQQTYARLREPLLSHRTITGLQKVHDEWHRESAVQKAMLTITLQASANRLERLELNERGHLERIQQLERALQERDDEVAELKKALDDSKRDQQRMKGQLQEMRKAKIGKK